MTLATCFWALTGAMVGGTHSLALKQSSTHANQWAALVGLLRIVLIGGVLTAAAILGYLFAAFAGWLVGFVMTLFIVMVRMK